MHGFNGMSAEQQQQTVEDNNDDEEQQNIRYKMLAELTEEERAKLRKELQTVEDRCEKKEKDKHRTANDKITSALRERNAVADMDDHTVWTWCPALGWLTEKELQRQIDELNRLAMLAMDIDGDDAPQDKGLGTDGGRREG